MISPDALFDELERRLGPEFHAGFDIHFDVAPRGERAVVYVGRSVYFETAQGEIITATVRGSRAELARIDEDGKRHHLAALPVGGWVGHDRSAVLEDAPRLAAKKTLAVLHGVKRQGGEG